MDAYQLGSPTRLRPRGGEIDKVNRIRQGALITGLRSRVRLRTRLRTRLAVCRSWLEARKSGAIRLYYWRDEPNFGDVFAAAVVTWLTGRAVTWTPPQARRKLVAVGSVLPWAVSAGDIVWGSGLIRPCTGKLPRTAVVLAVRGPLTARNLKLPADTPFGDPGLLVSLLLDPEDRSTAELRARTTQHYADAAQGGRKIVVVPNHVQFDTVRRFVRAHQMEHVVRVVDPRLQWWEVASAIRSAELVLSSSLHGLVFADAFHVPSLWFVASPPVVGGTFKYVDYFLGTGREPPRPMRLEGIPRIVDRVRRGDFELPEPLAGRELARLQETLIRVGRAGIQR